MKNPLSYLIIYSTYIYSQKPHIKWPLIPLFKCHKQVHNPQPETRSKTKFECTCTSCAWKGKRGQTYENHKQRKQRVKLKQKCQNEEKKTNKISFNTADRSDKSHRVLSKEQIVLDRLIAASAGTLHIGKPKHSATPSLSPSPTRMRISTDRRMNENNYDNCNGNCCCCCWWWRDRQLHERKREEREMHHN